MRREIIPLIAPHKTYVEPFAGASWVLFGKPPSPAEVLNDIDDELINLYLAVRDHLEEFRSYLEETPISEFLFNSWREGYTLPRGLDVKAACRLYYTIMNAFNGNIGGNPSFAVGPGKEAGFVKFHSTDWEAIRERLKRVTILSRDYIEVLKALDSPETFFYLDPPYLCAADTKKYYRHTLTENDHGRLMVYLSDIQGKFLMSYGDDPRDSLDEYDTLSIIPSSQVPDELFVLNYEPPDPPFYRSCRQGIPSPPGNQVEQVYPASRSDLPLGAQNGIPRLDPRRAPWTLPNCPYCGSRSIQQVAKRISLDGGRRSSEPCGYVCNGCNGLFKMEVESDS